jgi:hypothetical protein
MRSLCFQVDVAGGDEDVEMGSLGPRIASTARCGSPSLAARERRHGDPALGLLGDPPDRLEVAVRGGREAGLDDVDLEPLELARDLQLLAAVRPAPGACSPSRSVVSKMRTVPAGTSGPLGRATGVLIATRPA